MEDQVVETIVLAVIFALCIVYMVRKAIAKFSKSGSTCGGCSGCSASVEELSDDSAEKKDI